jgi:hypothetical protein
VTRVHRSDAGREVLSASQRLMDGLLVEERRCFAAIEQALRGVADDLETRVRRTAKQTGRASLIAGLAGLLPDDDVVRSAVMAPVGDLLAVTRERTLVVVRRQLKACESVVPARWDGVAGRAVAAAKAQSTQLEFNWFGRCWDGAAAGAGLTRLAMVGQTQTWWARGETTDELVQRLLSEELVRLPGAESRGAWWQLRGRCNAEARNASVGLTNGLLLAGMAAWNQTMTTS